MRIMMVSHAFPPTFGGVESHLWDISTRLVARGHEVCCLVGGTAPGESQEGGIRVTRRPELTVRHLLGRKPAPGAMVDSQLVERLRCTLSESLCAFSPSLIHIHNCHHFAPELALALFGCASHLPLINGVHDRVGEHLYEDVIRYEWSHVLYASHYLDATISTHRPSSVLWLGIDLGKFRAKGPLDDRLQALERPVIFHPARLLRWKGVEVSVRAFVRMKEALGRGTLVLCASENIVDDPEEVRSLRQELLHIAAQAKQAASLAFLTFDRAEIASAYRAADVIWYPTIDDEPFGLVPLEAMACAVPLVVSRSGGMMETVSDGITGLVVSKGSSEELAEATLRLLGDHALRERVLAGGLDMVQAFDTETYVDRLEILYGKVCGS